MDKYTPPFTFENLPNGDIQITDNTIEDAIRDMVNRLTDAKEAALKEAIKSLGWIAPEDIPAHNRKIAAETLRDAAEGMTCMHTGSCRVGPGDTCVREFDYFVLVAWLRSRANRIEQGGEL